MSCFPNRLQPPGEHEHPAPGGGDSLSAHHPECVHDAHARGPTSGTAGPPPPQTGAAGTEDLPDPGTYYLVFPMDPHERTWHSGT